MVQNVTRDPDYKDLDLNFGAHPATGDVSKLIGVEAVKRSIRNLVLTHFYERPFSPFIGSNATKLLFENMNPLTATFLENAIRETVQNFEPRAQILGVKVKQRPDNNMYEAELIIRVVNIPDPVIVNLFLERLR